MKQPNILLVYSYAPEEMRPTTAEHLYSFRNYSPYPITYVNLAKQALPTLAELSQFNLVIFHYLFLANHWGGADWFRGLMRQVAPILKIDAVKVALVQDEFYHSDLLCAFFNQFGINGVFCATPESEWAKTFRHVDLSRIHFFPTLTGFLDEQALKKPCFLKPAPKTVDIGYRTSAKPYFWFGRHGYLKQQIADAVLTHAPKYGLNINVSTRDEDVILGDAWYEFLAGCKYTVGVESGTSLVDYDGTIHKKTTQFAAAHPQATFEEAEAACFPGCDGNVQMFLLGPRHLEACLTRTCQILTDGRYSGVLRPWDHYIPLRKDLSNIDDVLQLVKQDTLRHDITERAYQDIVASGRYSYRRFVENVVETSMKYQGERNVSYWSFILRDAMQRLGQEACLVPRRAKGLLKKIAGKTVGRLLGKAG